MAVAKAGVVKKKRTPAPTVIVSVADKLLLSVDEFAAVIGLSRKRAYQEIMSSRVRSVKIGNRRLIPRVAIDEYIACLAAA